MCNVYSYMRISTSEERDLQKFTRQESALQRYAKENDIEYLLEFREDKSGKNFTERKQWQKLESIVQPGDMIVFKDICRFTREAEVGYMKYMELSNKGIELIFIDNQTVSTPYIKQLLNVAKAQNLVARTSLESTVKLLLIVELDRAEQERKITVQRIKDGIEASSKRSGRATGKLDKMSDELKEDIQLFIKDRSIKQNLKCGSCNKCIGNSRLDYPFHRDLIRCKAEDRKQGRDIPIYIAWKFDRPRDDVGRIAVFQEIDELERLRGLYGYTRAFRRRTGANDYQNGIRMGVVDKYHFSIRECEPIEKLISAIRKI